MTLQRVAVTGLGAIAAPGTNVAELFASVAAGHSAIRRLTAPHCERLRSPIGGVVPTDFTARFSTMRLKMLDRVSQLALVAAAEAVTDSAIDFAREQKERCGVFVGSSIGGAETTDTGYREMYCERSERVKPFSVLAAMTNAPAAWIAIDYGLTGPALTFSTACSSSAVAIGEAARRIQLGEADVMLAGGAEAPLTFGVLRAWEALTAVAHMDALDPSTSCRPFALTRSGLVLGEGAAFVVLESFEHAQARDATIHAELVGYGLTTDGGHITRPSVAAQAQTMRAALSAARLDAESIDYINAHGTATPQNDAVETAAIKEVLGLRAREVPVSSTKAVHGHLLGAAGALEFIIAVAALECGIVPPTMHLDVPDPACDLDYVPDVARSGVTLRAVMSNSFAFGGTNVVLIAQAAES